MKCTNCGREKELTVILLNDRRLCPSCVKKVSDSQLIIEQLKFDPLVRESLYRLYPPRVEDHPAACCFCRVRFDIGVQSKSLGFCIPCGFKYQPKEMKRVMKVLG